MKMLVVDHNINLELNSFKKLFEQYLRRLKQLVRLLKGFSTGAVHYYIYLLQTNLSV